MSKIVTLTALEKEKRLEDEYAFLQRQHRILEKDAVAFSNSSRSTIQTQEVLIQKLQDVKRDIMVQVTVAQNPTNAASDKRVEDDINRFLLHGNKIDHKIKKTRQYINEANREILTLERVAKKASKLALTELDVEMQTRRTARQVGILENRLYATNVKFNLKLAENTELRAKVESRINERTNFNAAHSKLVRKLTEGIKIMHDVIECGLHKYDEREEAQTVLHSLEERSNQDTAVQTYAMTELKRRQDHETVLKDYLAVKGQRRVMADLQAKMMAKRGAKRAERENLIVRYQEILEEVTDFAGDGNIGKIATLFTQQEDKNFKLYTYATGINHEVEDLEQHVDKLCENIDDLRFEEKQRKCQRDEDLKRLRSELSEKNSCAEQAQRDMESNKEGLAELFSGVEKLFSKVEADKAKITRLLGNHEHVHQHNYMRHLRMVEQRTVAMRNAVAYVESITQSFNLPLETYIVSTKPMPHPKLAQLEQTVPSQPCALCTEDKQLSNLEDSFRRATPLDRPCVVAKLEHDKMLAEFDARMHDVQQVCRKEKTAMKRMSRENLTTQDRTMMQRR